jgi:dihydropteroate synthase
VAVGDGQPVAIIGALNVSPESFFAASVHVQRDDLLRAADRMVAEGAAIIDVGGMSTAPYRSTGVSATEEAERLAEAVAALAQKFDVPISADTSRGTPARAALDAGATIVNDVTGLRGDPAVAALVAERDAGVIVMARAAGVASAAPAGAGPVEIVAHLLAGSLGIARATGIPEERIVLDPGIGFFREGPGPWYEWDAAIIAGLAGLGGLGRPLCVGVSRKSFIGALAGREDPGARLAGSLAATAIAVRNGAALIRTHDVRDTRDAIRVAEAMRP